MTRSSERSPGPFLFSCAVLVLIVLRFVSADAALAWVGALSIVIGIWFFRNPAVATATDLDAEHEAAQRGRQGRRKAGGLLGKLPPVDYWIEERAATDRSGSRRNGRQRLVALLACAVGAFLIVIAVSHTG